MAITDIPILAMLRTRMEWHQARQRVLAENVANADTPGFSAEELTPLTFSGDGGQGPAPVILARTDPMHLPGSGATGAGARRGDGDGFKVRDTGKGVNLEEQMMQVAANQMDFQEVATLYAKSLTLIKTALGKA